MAIALFITNRSKYFERHFAEVVRTDKSLTKGSLRIVFDCTALIEFRKHTRVNNQNLLKGHEKTRSEIRPSDIVKAKIELAFPVALHAVSFYCCV